MFVSNEIKYVGVKDLDVDLFEGQYPVPDGMTYNSYVITDFKIAVTDTVDAKFSKEWINNLECVLGDRNPDYLVVHHMEPDHSGSIMTFMRRYQNAKIVANKKAFTMMSQFFGCQFVDRQIVVSDGDTLELGNHTLKFLFAPMVHWPEVMVSYESYEKVLFSADAFGKFGSTVDTLDWACEARRYYTGIVAKYGLPVINLLSKVKTFDIKTICPLHGPVLKDNLGYYVGLYETWANYMPESQGVTVCFTSVYGNTKKAVDLLASVLTNKGEKVSVFDLARCDVSEALEDAFRYDRLVLASPTYCNSVFPFMSDFLTRLTERDFKNRVVGFIENGSWAPNAAKTMQNYLSVCKNLKYTENNVRILSSLNEASEKQIYALANELVALKNGD